MPDIPTTIEDILGPDGLLARSFKGFEFRPSQVEMALQIQDAIRKGIPAITEAGTGTGKTFSYLVPIILSGKKTVISTGTKNLQEQIYFKDLPLLQDATGLDGDAMILKGRKNYLCLHRFHQHFAQSSFLETGLAAVKKKLESWSQQTRFGDRSELPWLGDDDLLWDALSSTSDQCLGVNCLFAGKCFLSKLRSKAAKSRLIIVNHHLFFADLKVKKAGFGEILPRFQVALFDEAHNVEEIGTAYFGESVSTNQLTELLKDLEKALTGKGDADKRKLKKYLVNIKTATDKLFALFADLEPKGRLDPALLAVISEGPAMEISRGLKHVFEKVCVGHPEGFASQTAALPGSNALRALAVRAEELSGLLNQVLCQQDVNWLNWYEKRKRALALHASPLDISKGMDELLYQKISSVAFTSATLSTNGTFDYLRSRLNLPQKASEGIYPSHFDFETQTLMYLPKDLPTPNDPKFGTEIAQRIFEIVTRTQGRALVLFTSYHNLNQVWHILKEKVPYTVLRQGDAPRSLLLDRFRNDVHSILLGTSSFWQGVDVPGEALSCLIIDKLPFDSPGEPLVAARIDAIRDQGGNPFMEYQLPSAIIAFKQGLGRLIRKSTDRGVLAVLDKRIIESRYGELFLNSLPKIPIRHELSDISRFFKTGHGET